MIEALWNPTVATLPARRLFVLPTNFRGDLALSGA
jgi:hypothetical protein